MNVLITSAGRRTTLVEAFQSAVEPLGGRVLVADVDPLAPAHQVADGTVPLPRVTEGDYVLRLRAQVEDHDIDLIVPRIDPELPVLARHRHELEKTGATPLVSEPGFMDVAQDKWDSYRRFSDRGIDVPRTWLPDDLPPDGDRPQEFFVKPRRGSSSDHAYACETDELETYLEVVPDPVVQERIAAQEVTVDAYLDRDGTPIHYCPRARLKTFGGESYIGKTLDDSEIERNWITSVLEHLGEMGARGPQCFQVFLADRGPVLTEVNPRFGGGFPLTLAAGGGYPSWATSEARGRDVEPRLGEYERDLYMTKRHEELFLSEEDLPSEVE